MAIHGRYILSIEDRRRLRSVLRCGVWLPLTIMAVVICIVTLAALGWSAWLRQTDENTAGPASDGKAALTEMIMRVDSLSQQAEINRLYIDNIARLLDTGRMPLDSDAVVHPVPPMPPDSLMDATEAERSFASAIEGGSRFRASALAAMAAESVRFGPIASAAVQTHNSLQSEEAEIVITASAPVLAPADAKVIDLYFSGLDGGYTLLLQHPRGFLTRISGLGKVIVDAGTSLNTGDPIGFGPGKISHRRGTLRLRLWHNGAAMIPARYIPESTTNYRQQ